MKPVNVTYLPYLDYSNVEFHKPYDAGCRLLILYGLVFTVQNLEARPNLIQWFQREKLWEHVSETERAFLAGGEPEQRQLARLSWGLEGALTLGWALGLIQHLPDPTRTATDEELDAFFAVIPELGDETEAFLSRLSYRNFGEIFEENLVNELATGYFRDLHFNGQQDQTHINRAVSFERHKTLNWLTKFSGIADRDDTDMST
ncbi:MAG TPA: DUF4272 domain-containing protein [Puia sp.]|uniref:DUF4272 domain-containing protein n=1 Tax=Puia sp. TaxID=2045100 RepID=UPI002C6C7625|nr:DUF4272 domain-containing protein [Puia sp.]HVU98443.1 DUF4272 domain-containing protein [Puia sp.]